MKKELRFTDSNKKIKKNVEYIYPWLNTNCRSKFSKNFFYHWDDKKKLHTDINKIEKYYKEIIFNLTSILNKYHKINLSLRCWKIILGPWLWWFLDTVYERHQALNCHLKRNPKKKYFSFFFKKDNNHIPKSVETMSDYYYDNNQWNDQIFLKIIRHFFPSKIKIVFQKFDNPEIKKFIKKENSIYKKDTKYFLNIILKKIIICQKHLLCKGTFGFFENLKLNYELGSVPNFYLPKNFVLKKKN